METSVVLEFTIAVLAGLILATLVTPIKRALPYWFETALWLGLIVACWIAITGLGSGSPRDVMESAIWGAQQVFTTSIGLLFSGLAGWIFEQRFAVANAVLLIVGADILVLALLFSRRNSRRWQPEVRLQEWFEFPRDLKPARTTVAAAEPPFAGLDRSGAAAASAAGAASATWFTHFLIWTRDVFMPRVGTQIESKARELRETHGPAIVQVLRTRTQPAGPRHLEEEESARDSDRLAS